MRAVSRGSVTTFETAWQVRVSHRKFCPEVDWHGPASVKSMVGQSLPNILKWLLLLVLLHPALVVPQQNRPVSVLIRGVEGQLLRNVHSTVEIWQFNGKPAPSDARLRYMHQQAKSQIRDALTPYGYYRAEVTSRLSDLGQQWQAVYEISPGTQIPVGEVDIQALADTTPDNREALDQFEEALRKAQIVVDGPLNQQAYDDLKQTWQTLAARLGYFDAKFTRSQIRVDLRAYEARIFLHYELGDRYRFGRVEFSQMRDWIRPGLLDRYNDISEGELYDAATLQQLQSGLAASEFYEDILIRAAPDTAIDKTIPVDVKLTPNNPRRYVFGLGFGTDTGVRVKWGLTGRRINDRGHRIVSEAQISEIGSGIAGEYSVPTGDPRSDSYRLRASFEREKSDARNFQRVLLGGSYHYRDGLWFKTYSLDYQFEEFELEDATPTTRLLIPGAEWTRTYPVELDKRINVREGSWISLRLRGGSESLVSDTSFVQGSLAGKWIETVREDHRLIVRGALGTTWAADFNKVPSSLRFYTGGDRSVRGYNFEVIGPLGEDNEVAGGEHLVETSIEYEVPFRDRWSLAGFIDTGDAFNDSLNLRTGVGVGFRWQSPVGPVRFDIGRSLDEPGRGNVRLHLSVGPDL